MSATMTGLIGQPPWGSLPVHLTTLGVSQDTLRAGRYPSDVPYAQRLSEAKRHVAARGGKPGSHAEHAANSRQSHSPPRYQLPLHLMTPDLHGRPVSTGTLWHHVNQSTGQASDNVRTSLPRGALHCTSPSGSPQRGPLLQELDFQAMADSSVGGSGLPRPYGRFIGDRMGDGKALYERRPTTRAASWHAKMFGIPDPAQQEAEARAKRRTASPSKTTGRVEYDSNMADAAVQEPAHRQPTLQEQQQQQQDGSRYWRPTTIRTTSEEASWPGPRTTRFPLPAATFLTAAPPLPSNLRVDCGLGAAREHLQSSQSPTRPRLAPSVQRGGDAAGPPSLQAWDVRPATTGGQGVLEPGSPHTMRSRGRSSPPFSGHAPYPPGPDQHHPQSLASTGQSGSAWSVPYEIVPASYKRVHGAYVPINQVVEDSVRTSLGLTNLHGAQVPHTTQVLDAMADSQRVRVVSPLRSSAPLLSTSHPCYHCSIRPPLPPEQTLPRRCMPWKGR